MKAGKSGTAAEGAHEFVRVRGAREHNLKNVDVDIPGDSEGERSRRHDGGRRLEQLEIGRCVVVLLPLLGEEPQATTHTAQPFVRRCGSLGTPFFTSPFISCSVAQPVFSLSAPLRENFTRETKGVPAPRRRYYLRVSSGIRPAVR
jgi:hypothetical protein